MGNFNALNNKLFHALEHLVPTLAQLLGYRVTLSKSTKEMPEQRFMLSEHGHLLFKISIHPGSVPVGVIEVDAAARTDDFATRTVARFVSTVRHFFGKCYTARQVVELLLKDEQFFWDNLVLSINTANENFSVHKVLLTMREALHFRYEGEQPSFGIHMTWNLNRLRANDSIRLLDIQGAPRLDALLQTWKGAHVLSNGESAMLIITAGGRASHMAIPRAADLGTQMAGWELVPQEYRWLSILGSGRDVSITNSGVGEQLLLTSKFALKWSRRSWTRLTHNRVSSLTSSYLPAGIASLFLQILGELSFARTGALIVVSDEKQAATLLQQATRGINGRFNEPIAFELTAGTKALFKKLCSLDGATVLNRTGKLVDAGLILSHTQDTHSPEEGSRTAAARAASHYGLAIKVSADGPVTVYRNGQKMALVS